MNNDDALGQPEIEHDFAHLKRKNKNKNRLACSKGRGFSHVGFLYCYLIQYDTTFKRAGRLCFV